MKLEHAAVASALALLLLAALHWTAEARGRHGFHFSNRLHAAHHHRGPYRAWPFYGGGIVATAPYAPLNTVSYVAPPTIVYVPLPPRALTCHRTRETVAVPAETGGTRQITVTRC